MAQSADENAAAEENARQQGENRRLRDLDLLAAYRAGDPAAATTLFELYREDALVAARAAAPDPDTAEDFVAEAFVKVFGLLDRGKGPTGSFRYYLRATIRTVALDWYRSQANTVYTSDYGPLEPLISDQSVDRGDRDPETRFLTGAGSEIISAFQQLPERWRRVIFLKVVEGRGDAESARELGVSANTTAVLYRRAREGLRKGYLSEVANVLSVDGNPECRALAGDLAASVSGRVPLSRQRRLNAHLAYCKTCNSNRGEIENLAKRFSSKAIAPVLAGVAGSVILPALNTGTHAAAASFWEALRGASWLHFSVIGAVGIAAIVTAVVFIVNAGEGASGEGGSSRISIEYGADENPGGLVEGARSGGVCSLVFGPSGRGTALATLTTSNTGAGECTMRAWLDGEEIVAPYRVTTSQAIVLMRPGKLLVELSAGDRTESRTFVVAEG